MATVSLLNRIQAATDTFYNHTYYAGFIAVQAHREGVDKGLRGAALAQFQNERKSNPPDEYRAKAVAQAQALTARRKLRGKLLSWLVAIVWISSGLYLFSSASQTSLFSVGGLGFFVIGTLVAAFFIGGVFQILFGLSNLLRLIVEGVVMWAIGSVLNTAVFEGVNARIIIKLRLVPTIIFGGTIIILQIIVTVFVAFWVFRHII